MGWNSLSFPVKGRLFEGIEEGSEVYFVHSYYLPLTAEGAGMQKPEYLITAAADYGVEIGASIEKDNVFGCQFHPEKSGRRGLKILENFLKVCGTVIMLAKRIIGKEQMNWYFSTSLLPATQGIRLLRWYAALPKRFLFHLRSAAEFAR